MLHHFFHPFFKIDWSVFPGIKEKSWDRYFTNLFRLYTLYISFDDPYNCDCCFSQLFTLYNDNYPDVELISPTRFQLKCKGYSLSIDRYWTTISYTFVFKVHE
ncbi:hypothetical protein [Capybara microvirus Cap3_SP_315]|nr:hypothetical protein [Capybara microvirus Cap3_SP_315]